MSFIANYGKSQWRALPLLADSITTADITFSDGSEMTTAANILNDSTTTGVYYTSNNFDFFVPIPCSTTNISNLTSDTIISVAADIGFIVLPGWGFTIYQNTAYGGTASYQMTNSGSTKLLYYVANAGTEYGGGTVVKASNGTDNWATDGHSIKVYYNSVEQTCTGIS